MSYKPVACYCHHTCHTCATNSTGPQAIAQHNLRVSCHGERKYPQTPRTPRYQPSVPRPVSC